MAANYVIRAGNKSLARPFQIKWPPLFFLNRPPTFDCPEKVQALLRNVPTEYFKYYHATLYHHMYCPK
jgi:hypothetical protein